MTPRFIIWNDNHGAYLGGRGQCTIENFVEVMTPPIKAVPTFVSAQEAHEFLLKEFGPEYVINLPSYRLVEVYPLDNRTEANADDLRRVNLPVGRLR